MKMIPLGISFHCMSLMKQGRKIIKLMTSFKYLYWTRLLHVSCFYGIFLLPRISRVRSQCTEGYEFGCVWTHDEKAPLKWVPDSESGQSFVRVTGCPQRECGTAVMQSPWLEPRDREMKLILHYKLYGTSAVFLRLYLKTEDAGGQQVLFSKDGNYKLTFPKEWKSKEIVIPRVQSRHRLILKAHIPYAEAYVAVKGINLDGIISIITSTTTPPPTSTTQSSEEDFTTVSACTSEETGGFPELLDFTDDYEEEDNKGQYREDEDQYEIEQLNNGYTREMDPHICKYRKPKKLKFR